MAAKSRSAKFYAQNPEAREKKKAYAAQYNKRPDQVKKRVELNAFNRKQTKLGNNKKGDGMDASHKGDKIVGYSQQSRNRGDKNNSAGDARSRSAARRPGGKRR